MLCDLHNHSIFSDGTDTPEELITRAETLGLQAVALTDHNNVDGLARFLAAGQGSSVTAVPGVEFTTGYRDRELHILALFVEENRFTALRAFAELPHRRKEESNLALAEALNRAGYHIDYPAIKSAHPGGSVNRAHFAKALVEMGYVKTRDEAFDTLLKPGGKFYVPPRRLDVFETIRFIRELGAVAVFAHPYLTLKPEEVADFLPAAKEAGLDGMEVRYSTYAPEITALAEETAKQFGLLPSGGSDYHGGNKPGLAMGTGYGNLRVPGEWFEALQDLSNQRLN